MRVEQLIDAYLADRRRHGCRPNSLRHYISRLNPLRETLGDRAVADLTRDELLDWLVAVTDLIIRANLQGKLLTIAEHVAERSNKQFRDVIEWLLSGEHFARIAVA